MAATPKGPQKMTLNYAVDRGAYDVFVVACSRKGFAPQVILEKFMKKYAETGQI